MIELPEDKKLMYKRFMGIYWNTRDWYKYGRMSTNFRGYKLFISKNKWKIKGKTHYCIKDIHSENYLWDWNGEPITDYIEAHNILFEMVYKELQKKGETKLINKRKII